MPGRTLKCGVGPFHACVIPHVLNLTFPFLDVSSKSDASLASKSSYSCALVRRVMGVLATLDEARRRQIVALNGRVGEDLALPARQLAATPLARHEREHFSYRSGLALDGDLAKLWRSALSRLQPHQPEFAICSPWRSADTSSVKCGSKKISRSSPSCSMGQHLDSSASPIILLMISRLGPTSRLVPLRSSPQLPKPTRWSMFADLEAHGTRMAAVW